MAKRIIFGLLMIAVLAGLLWLDWWMEHSLAETPAGRWLCGLPLAVLLLLLTTIVLTELARLAAGAGIRLLPVSALCGTAALTTLPFWWRFVQPDQPSAQQLLVVLGLITMSVFAEQMIRRQVEDAMQRVACTLLAVLYLGAGGAMVIGLRLTYGVGMLAVFLVAVKSADIGAYFVGSAIGRHKLIPWLSPGKSWEGLFGGLATAAGVSVLAVRLLAGGQLPLPQAAVFGAVVGLAGQFGDLCESLLKRSARQKDSGSLVPQFGGALDIIDSPLLAAPIALLLLWAMS